MLDGRSRGLTISEDEGKGLDLEVNGSVCVRQLHDGWAHNLFSKREAPFFVGYSARRDPRKTMDERGIFEVLLSLSFRASDSMESVEEKVGAGSGNDRGGSSVD